MGRIAVQKGIAYRISRRDVLARGRFQRLRAFAFCDVGGG